jgi:glycosyltransferase involved in cell wall biosynthesis
MKLPIYIYDPTATDAASKIRGVGRYMQLLQSSFEDTAVFVSSVDNVPYDSVFIFPFFNFLSKPLSFRRIARKQIAVVHDLIPFKYPEHFPIGVRGIIQTYLNKFILKQYDAIVTDSETSKKDIINMLGFGDKFVQVIYPILSEKVVKKSKSLHTELIPSHPYYLYVGDVTWNKNIVNLARALKIANASCIFVGKHFIPSKLQLTLARKKIHPWEEELFSFYEEAQGDSRFLLHGFVDDDVLQALYQNAIANILISRDEGFGFSYLEAAYHSTPSVLADRPIFHETAGPTAVFANPEDPLDIADKLKKIALPAERSHYARQLSEHIQKYNQDQFIGGFRKVIAEVQRKG